jgi:hypothetical protein
LVNSPLFFTPSGSATAAAAIITTTTTTVTLMIHLGYLHIYALTQQQRPA